MLNVIDELALTVSVAGTVIVSGPFVTVLVSRSDPINVCVSPSSAQDDGGLRGIPVECWSLMAAKGYR